MQGVVSQEPDIRDRSIDYVVNVRSIQRGPHSVAVSGKVLVRTPRSQTLEYGDAVTLTGRLISPRNTSTVPYAAILANRGIGSEMRYPRLLNQGPVQTGWLGWVIRLRQDLEAGINMWLPEPEAALLIAITLGARSASLGNMAPVLIATGLIHIIAISGIKVALVAGTVYELARRLPSRLSALLAGLGGLLVYTLLTGATASGQRSALMWALVFIGAYLGRRTVALVSLSAVGAGMVLVDPALLGDIGFQLSMVGTLSIVALADPLIQRFWLIPSPFREALCVTMAAQLGTLPIVILGFHLVSLSGWVANAVVLPLLPALIVLGFLLGAVSTVAPVAQPVAACAYELTHSIVMGARWLASMPGVVPASRIPTAVSTIYYVLLGIVAWMIFRRTMWHGDSRWTDRLGEAWLSVGVTAALLTASLVSADARTDSRLVWLGTGDAFLLRCGGASVLVDGSAQPFTLLERLGETLPYGTQTLDIVIVTDPRPSSITGLREVLQHYRVESILDVGAEYPSSTYAGWRADIRRKQIPIYSLRTGSSVRVGESTIVAAGPDGVRPNPQDSIGLLQITTKRHTFLLVGAADLEEQREAVFRSIPLHVGTLVSVGRNGVDSSLLHAVHPSLLLSVKPTLSPVQTVVLRAGHARSWPL